MTVSVDRSLRRGTLLARLTWPEAETVGGRSVLVLPLGATEQHGPHLPLSTDTDIAVALARALCDCRNDVVVGPALAYGSSGEHADFAGTLSIGQEATELIVVELGRSASATFPRLLFVCGHGGNTEPLGRGIELLRAEGRDARLYLPNWSQDAHAGRVETSLMLAIASTRVRLDRAEAGNSAVLEEILPKLRAEGVRALSPNGVLGDPADASASEGRRLLDRAVRELVDLVNQWDVGS